MATDDMAPLRLALPSKGRLLDPTLAFLERCGFTVKGVRGSREYSAHIPALPACVIDLTAASEIPERLAAGEVHLGVTGLDLISEMLGRQPRSLSDLSPGSLTAGDRGPVQIHSLGFGRADLVVAVPRSWIDVDTMADLAEVAQLHRRRHGRRMRIATKYRTLTRQFLTDTNVVDYRIVRSAGATEAAPATGAADIVVDITSTGETLAANHLKTIRNGTILFSQATLFVSGSAKAAWTPTVLRDVKRFLDMMDARITAAGRKLILTRLPGRPADRTEADFAAQIARAEAELTALVHSRVEFLQGSLTGAGGNPAEGLSVMLTVPSAKTHDVVTVLKAHGGREIIVLDTDYVFDNERSSFEQLLDGLGPTDAS
ncbi:MAG: ATP phosphoribosyltransferase [Alphaproteobacteria bacterium]